jgi:AraC family transcriptional regulator
MKKESSIKEYRVRLNRVFNFINDNLARKIQLEEIASVSFFSPFHFHRIFTAFTGESPADFINRLRVEKAANLLLFNPTLSISEVSFTCGFPTPASLARAFKKHFGINASKWRENPINKKSKIRQAESKKRKESPLMNEYISGVEKISFIKIKEYKMKTEIKEMPSFNVAYASVMGDYNTTAGKAWEKVCRWAGPRGLLNESTKYIGISFDNPEITAPEKCRYYACVTVPEKTKVDGEISLLTIQPGKHMVARFQGKGKDILAAYNTLCGKILPEQGYQPDDNPAYEIYNKEPDAESNFDMDICIPVKPM